MSPKPMTDRNKPRWYMATLIGPDRPGIVARLTAALQQAGYEFGEASMARLGGQFSAMLMVRTAEPAEQIAVRVAPVADALGLTWHVDPIVGALHSQRYPDVRITAGAPERPGILGEVSNALAEAGLDVITLEADIAGDPEEPVYIVHLEGIAARGIDALHAAAERLRDEEIDIEVAPLELIEG